MKKKIIILMSLILLGSSTPTALSIQTQIPQNNIQITEEEAFHENTQNTFFSFIGAIIKFFRGDSAGITVKSNDVREFSSAIKDYQDIEEKNNPDYQNSHAKEKADFGRGLLDIIAGILSFFGL